MLVFFFLFVVLPLAELFVIIKVGSAIGALATIGLLLLSSIVGAWLAKREGLGVLRRFRRTLRDGELPDRELVDGFLIALGGILMFVPGFITDALGLLLLLPPIRALVRGRILHRSGLGRGGLRGNTAGGGPRIFVENTAPPRDPHHPSQYRTELDRGQDPSAN